MKRKENGMKERKQREEKGNGEKRKEIILRQEMILGSIITQIINCQSDKRRKIDRASIHATIN